MVEWRSGRRNAYTIYQQTGATPDGDDSYVGSLLTPELSAQAVDAVNDVERLRAERAGWWNAALADTPQGELVEARAAVERVRKLHRVIEDGDDQWCVACSGALDIGDDGYWTPRTTGSLVRWPCPTIRALDGDGSIDGYEAGYRDGRGHHEGGPSMRAYNLNDGDIIVVAGRRMQLRDDLLCHLLDGEQPHGWDLDG